MKKTSKFFSVILLAVLLLGLIAALGPEVKAAAIDGQYYIWGEDPTHGQPTGTDMGLFNKTRSSAWTKRTCSSWVQFFFDEDGTYTGGNTFSDFYIHVWWSSIETSEGITFGYDVNGTDSYSGMEQSWNLSSYVRFLYTNGTWTERSHSDYRLTVKYFDITDWVLTGDEVYDFNIHFNSLTSTCNAFPEGASPARDSSFIIINLPSNSTLQVQDSDGDGLSDYDELYTYYTDPQLADTFGTGWKDNGDPTGLESDYQEIYFNNSRQMQILTFTGLESNLSYVTFNKDWYVVSANITVSAFPTPLHWGAANNTGSTGIAIGDVNNDADNELIVAGRNGAVNVYNTSDWSLLLSVDPGGRVCSIPIADLNSTYAGNEFVFPEYGGIVTVYNSTFDQIWSADVGAKPYGAAIADCDEDSNPELIIGQNGDFQVYSSSFVFEHSENSNGSIGSVAVGDVNNDGTTEIVIGDYYGWVAVFNSSSNYAKIKEWQCLASLGSVRAALEDIDNDGKNEVVVAGKYGVAAYRLLGDDLTKLWESDYIGVVGTPECSLIVADLDGDNKYETVASFPSTSHANGTIWIFDYQGNLLRQWNNPRMATIAWGDVDNDGDNDLALDYCEHTTEFTVYNGFPCGVSVDVGNNGVNEFSTSKVLLSNQTFDITSALNIYIDSAETDSVDIPVNVTSTGGSLGVSFRIIYQKEPFSWGAWWGNWWIIPSLLAALLIFLKKQEVTVNPHVLLGLIVVIEDSFLRVLPIMFLGAWMSLWSIFVLSVFADALAHVFKDVNLLPKGLGLSLMYNGVWYGLFLLGGFLIHPYVGILFGILFHYLLDVFLTRKKFEELF